MHGGKQKNHPARNHTGATNPAPTQESSAGRSGLAWHQAEGLQTLAEVCDGPLVVQVIASDLSAVCRAKLFSVDENFLTLSICDPQEGAVFWPMDICVVFFMHRDRPHYFVSHIWEYRAAGDAQADPVIVLSAPAAVIVERRLSFRVPVLPNSGVKAQIIAPNEAVWEPGLRDISLGGALLDFAPGPAPDLKPGDSIDVMIRLGRDAVRLKGLMRRRREWLYSISFPDVAKRGNIEPPQALCKIVQTLEGYWLKQRAA